MEGDEIEGSHTFNADNSVFNFTKTKHNGKSKTRIVSEVPESNNRTDFYIGEIFILANVNRKYGIFEANY